MRQGRDVLKVLGSKRDTRHLSVVHSAIQCDGMRKQQLNFAVQAGPVETLVIKKRAIQIYVILD